MISCEGCGASNPTKQCPKCKELKLPPSYFCGDQCFRQCWTLHKAKHTNPLPSIQTMTNLELATFNFTGSLRPGKITPKRIVPVGIARPDYADEPSGRSAIEEQERSNKVAKWSGEQLKQIRKVCSLCREVLDIGVAAVRPSVTTDEIDRVVHEATIERGMYPSPLNYYSFPKSVCTSVNEVICHGIPDSRGLEAGDIVNLDVSSYLNGFHGDVNETIFVGKPDADSVRLVNCAYECLMEGIRAVGKDNLYRNIGEAIEHRAMQSQCSVVRTYCGHGVCDKFHCAPSVPHYYPNKAVGIMQVGHVFTIEPMINLGTWEDVTWPDKWTSATRDGKRSAQFEHTLLVTPKGPEILTDWREQTPHFMRQLHEWNIELN